MSIQPASSNTAPTTGAANAAPSSSLAKLATTDTFLKLFVAQLKNQDPLSTQQQDPTQMVTQLAQFSQLEQTVNIGTDVHTIAGVVNPTTAAATAAASGSTSQTSLNSQSSSSSQSSKTQSS